MKSVVLMLICSFLYAINQIILKKITKGYIHLFMVSYFNDLVAGLLIIDIWNIVMILVGYKRTNRLFQIAIINLLIGLFWEYSPNLFRKEAVSDVLDIVAYEIGGVIYWIVMSVTGEKT